MTGSQNTSMYFIAFVAFVSIYTLMYFDFIYIQNQILDIIFAENLLLMD